MRRLCINFCAARVIAVVDVPFLQVGVTPSVVSDLLKHDLESYGWWYMLVSGKLSISC